MAVMCGGRKGWEANPESQRVQEGKLRMYVITFKAKFEEESGVGGIIIVVEVHTSNKNNNKYGQPNISAKKHENNT